MNRACSRRSPCADSRKPPAFWRGRCHCGRSLGLPAPAMALAGPLSVCPGLPKRCLKLVFHLVKSPWPMLGCHWPRNSRVGALLNRAGRMIPVYPWPPWNIGLPTAPPSRWKRSFPITPGILWRSREMPKKCGPRPGGLSSGAAPAKTNLGRQALLRSRSTIRRSR